MLQIHIFIYDVFLVFIILIDIVILALLAFGNNIFARSRYAGRERHAEYGYTINGQQRRAMRLQPMYRCW